MNNGFISPSAIAFVTGNEKYPRLHGTVEFYTERDGVVVTATVDGLPANNPSGFFALHIHEGADCGGEHFADTGGHYSRELMEHPNHSGDLPPLLYCDGKANMAVLSDRFTIDEIIGKTVVIHGGADDFYTQPAGNSGERIACGVIRRADGGDGPFTRR